MKEEDANEFAQACHIYIRSQPRRLIVIQLVTYLLLFEEKVIPKNKTASKAKAPSEPNGCRCSPPLKVTPGAAVGLLLGTSRRKPNWQEIQKMLASPKFLAELKCFDAGTCSPAAVSQATTIAKQDFFNPAAMGKVSLAGASLCTWVTNMLKLTSNKAASVEEGEKRTTSVETGGEESDCNQRGMAQRL